MVEKIFFYKNIRRLYEVSRGKKTVLVGGCFDIFHFGHLTFLEKARQEGDYLIVALESDQFIRIKKKRPPVHNQKQRAEILANLILVDAVLLLPFFTSDQDYFDMVKKIEPKTIAITNGDPKKEQKIKQMRHPQGKVVEVSPLLTNFSTNRILEILKKEL